jgi:hypothetical protein
MAALLTPAQIAEYADKGYVTVPRVLDAAERKVLEAAMLAVTAATARR